MEFGRGTATNRFNGLLQLPSLSCVISIANDKGDRNVTTNTIMNCMVVEACLVMHLDDYFSFEICFKCATINC